MTGIMDRLRDDGSGKNLVGAYHVHVEDCEDDRF